MFNLFFTDSKDLTTNHTKVKARKKMCLLFPYPPSQPRNYNYWADYAALFVTPQGAVARVIVTFFLVLDDYLKLQVKLTERWRPLLFLPWAENNKTHK